MNPLRPIDRPLDVRRQDCLVHHFEALERQLLRELTDVEGQGGCEDGRVLPPGLEPALRRTGHARELRVGHVLLAERHDLPEGRDPHAEEALDDTGRPHLRPLRRDFGVGNAEVAAPALLGPVLGVQADRHARGRHRHELGLPADSYEVLHRRRDLVLQDLGVLVDVHRRDDAHARPIDGRVPQGFFLQLPGHRDFRDAAREQGPAGQVLPLTHHVGVVAMRVVDGRVPGHQDFAAVIRLHGRVERGHVDDRHTVLVQRPVRRMDDFNEILRRAVGREHHPRPDARGLHAHPLDLLGRLVHPRTAVAVGQDARPEVLLGQVLALEDDPTRLEVGRVRRDHDLDPRPQRVDGRLVLADVGHRDVGRPFLPQVAECTAQGLVRDGRHVEGSVGNLGRGVAVVSHPKDGQGLVLPGRVRQEGRPIGGRAGRLTVGRQVGQGDVAAAQADALLPARVQHHPAVGVKVLGGQFDLVAQAVGQPGVDQVVEECDGVCPSLVIRHFASCQGPGEGRGAKVHTLVDDVVHHHGTTIGRAFPREGVLAGPLMLLAVLRLAFPLAVPDLIGGGHARPQVGKGSCLGELGPQAVHEFLGGGIGRIQQGVLVAGHRTFRTLAGVARLLAACKRSRSS